MAVVMHLTCAQHVHTISSELDAFLDAAADRRGLSQNTLTAYRSDLLAAARVLTTPLDTITLADVEAFLIGRQESQATTNRRIASLRQFFRWTQRQGYRPDNPVDLVEAMREDEKLSRPIKGGDLGQSHLPDCIRWRSRAIASS